MFPGHSHILSSFLDDTILFVVAARVRLASGTISLIPILAWERGYVCILQCTLSLVPRPSITLRGGRPGKTPT